MKKLFISLFVAIGLTGLARTHAQETAPAMEKLADYVLSTQANSTFTFIDLSSAEEAGEHGIRTMPIGEDLPTGEDLTNRYYGFAMESNGFTINPSDATDGMAVALCHYYATSGPLCALLGDERVKGLGGGRKAASKSGSQSWEQFLRAHPDRELK